MFSPRYLPALQLRHLSTPSYRLVRISLLHCSLLFFFFNDTATTEIYTLSLHDALPIYGASSALRLRDLFLASLVGRGHFRRQDRKSTRLNSSHTVISYAVFCLKKKKRKSRRTLE